jgi:hypothetical protein
MTRRALVAAVVMPLLFSTGCISLFVEMFTDPMGRKAAFKRSQRQYTKYVRWGDVEGAARFVHPELREKFLGTEEEFEGIGITDFEVGEMEFGDKDSRATVRVTYFAYSLASMLEKEIKETQQWERLGRGNDWVVRPHLQGLVEQVADLR